MPRLARVLIAAVLVVVACPSSHARADSLPRTRQEQMPPATPSPKNDAPGSGATQAQCRDGTFVDAISGKEAPCHDHGGIATSQEKPGG
jgi:hypothetical protein